MHRSLRTGPPWRDPGPELAMSRIPGGQPVNVAGSHRVSSATMAPSRGRPSASSAFFHAWRSNTFRESRTGWRPLIVPSCSVMLSAAASTSLQCGGKGRAFGHDPRGRAGTGSIGNHRQCCGTRGRNSADRDLRTDERFKDKYLKSIPQQRWAEPEEIAGAFVFLAAADSEYITGQTLSVDGGRLVVR